MPIEQTQFLLIVALCSFLLLLKIAVDIGRIAGRLSDHELARETVEELTRASLKEA